MYTWRGFETVALRVRSNATFRRSLVKSGSTRSARGCVRASVSDLKLDCSICSINAKTTQGNANSLGKVTHSNLDSLPICLGDNVVASAWNESCVSRHLDGCVLRRRVARSSVCDDGCISVCWLRKSELWAVSERRCCSLWNRQGVSWMQSNVDPPRSEFDVWLWHKARQCGTSD